MAVTAILPKAVILLLLDQHLYSGGGLLLSRLVFRVLLCVLLQHNLGWNYILAYWWSRLLSILDCSSSVYLLFIVALAVCGVGGGSWLILIL